MWKYLFADIVNLKLLAGLIDFGVLVCYNLVTLCVLEFSKYDRIY